MKNAVVTTAIVLYLLNPASWVQAEVFKWIDAEGKIHYSDKKPENQSVKQIKIQPHRSSATVESSSLEKNLNSKESTGTDKKPYKKKHKITMYAASWCSYCKTARAYFKKNNISFSEYDIEKNTNARKRYEKFGGTGVPLLVAKRKHMQGFSEAKFESWYQSL